MAELIYAGIGSRKTPSPMQLRMSYSAGVMAKHGWILRSGGAEGADEAFERGLLPTDPREIYLPELGWRNNPSPFGLDEMEFKYDAWEYVKKYHPAWQKLGSQFVRKLMTRNVFQILGKDLDRPADMVVCWTQGGGLVGGTAFALRLARIFHIPVYNLGDIKDELAFDAFLKPMEDLDDE